MLHGRIRTLKTDKKENMLKIQVINNMEQEQTNIKDTTKYRVPRMYKVIMLNDDYTTMDFVVMVLEKTFHLPSDRAQQVMMTIHTEGQAVVGVYTLDIAKTKVGQVTIMAQEEGFPLRLIYQPE